MPLKSGRTTFSTHLGIAGAETRVRELVANATAALSVFGDEAVVRRLSRNMSEYGNSKQRLCMFTFCWLAGIGASALWATGLAWLAGFSSQDILTGA